MAFPGGNQETFFSVGDLVVLEIFSKRKGKKFYNDVPSS